MPKPEIIGSLRSSYTRVARMVCEEKGIDFRFVDAGDDILKTFRAGSTHGRTAEPHGIDRERLESVLKELVSCRQMLDQALKDG